MIIIFFILGLFIGSFLNMLIDRMPRDEQIITGRSHCDSCKHALAWHDLIPIISWLTLQGKCRYCHKPVPFRNTLVELVTGALFAATYKIMIYPFFDPTSSQVQIVDYVSVICIFTIISCLIAIFFIDLKHQIIPDSLTVIASFSAIIIHTMSYYAARSSTTPLNYVFSALGASLFFAFLIVITKGKGMGWGDVKFAAFMGLLLGFPRIVFSLYFAFLTGAFVSAILIFGKRKKFGQTIAFGPFLVLATIFAQFGLLDIVWHYIYGNLL